MTDTREFLQIEEEMLRTIERVDEYSKNKGTLGGLSWGRKQFNDAFEGLQPGLILVAAGPNVGKSALCLQLAWEIAEANRIPTEESTEKAYVIYFSLDDNATEILPRIIALDQSIKIGVAKSPKRYEQEVDALLRRERGIERLKERIDIFKLIDGSRGNSIEFIESTVKKHIEELEKRKEEKYKVVVFIDNFYDITVETRFGTGSVQEKLEHIADRLSTLCTVYDMPIICTAELRKINGSRRPGMEDVRETVKLEYEAKAILTCYNEVGLKGPQAANIYYEEDGERKPILEVRFVKNKYSSYKGRLYLAFNPDCSQLSDVPFEMKTIFDQMALS